MTDEGHHHDEERQRGAEQAQALRAQADAGALSFDVYLPPSLAAWILDKIERGVFTDPSEAVFVLLGERRDLEPHADLRAAVLNRYIQAAVDGPRPLVPIEEVRRTLRDMSAAPRTEPAVWPRRE